MHIYPRVRQSALTVICYPGSWKAVWVRLIWSLCVWSSTVCGSSLIKTLNSVHHLWVLQGKSSFLLQVLSHFKCNSLFYFSLCDTISFYYWLLCFALVSPPRETCSKGCWDLCVPMEPTLSRSNRSSRGNITVSYIFLSNVYVEDVPLRLYLYSFNFL